MSRLADDIDQESVASNEEDELDDLRFGGHYGQRKRRLQRKPRQHDAVGNQLGVGAVGAYTAPAASTTAEAKPVVINTSACKGPMMECVAEVLAKRQGCELIDDPSRKNDDLYIIMTRESLKMRIARMGRKSMVSKFPCMYNLCTNTVFSQCMEFALKMLPAPANPSDTYWPETFRIPAQMKQIEAAMKRAAQQHTGPKRAPPAWIVKPTLRGENNQGLVLDQIFITTHFDELEDRFMGKTLSCDWVCQRYVQNPLLIDGLKFDFRIFATVVSLDPLEIHISRNSVARFCTEPFQPVRPGKVLKGHDALMHVTSFHLNRVARNYKPATQTAFNDDTDSSKRPLATVLRQIRRRGKNDQYAGFSEKHFWEQIEEATAVAVTAMLPVLRVSYIRHFADARKGGRSHEEAFAGGCQAFQTIALDFVMQDTLHPVLVQVNNQPSMGLTPPPINDKGLMPNINAKAGASRVNVRSTGGVCPVDRVVKTAVFSGSLELLQVFQDPARQYAQINGGLKKALKVAEASAAAEAAEASPEKSSKNSKSTTGNINYFPVDMAKVAHLERCVKLVEMLYLKCGGIKKAFNPSVLKKELAKCSTMFHKKFTKPDLTIVMAPFRDNHRMVKEGASDEGFQEDIAVLAFANMMQQICCKTHRSEEHVLSRLVTILSEVCNPPAKGKKGRENVAAPVLSPAPPPPTIPFPAAATPPLPPPAGAAGAAASEAATSRRASDGPSRKPSRRASNLAALDRSASNISAISNWSDVDDDLDSDVIGESLSSLTGVGDEMKQRMMAKLADVSGGADEVNALFASDAAQETRIAKLEKRVATLSELVGVLLPYAKMRFEEEDRKVEEEVEKQLLAQLQLQQERREARKAKKKKAKQNLLMITANERREAQEKKRSREAQVRKRQRNARRDGNQSELTVPAPAMLPPMTPGAGRPRTGGLPRTPSKSEMKRGKKRGSKSKGR